VLNPKEVNTMSDIQKLENELNEGILTGRALDVFDKFYAEDVVMQENSDAPFVGKSFNRKREEEFFSSIAEFHGAKLLGSAVAADRSFSEWLLDVTFKNGARVKLEQVAVRQWKDGHVVHERFYYNKG
jgi:hypothetical protein